MYTGCLNKVNEPSRRMYEWRTGKYLTEIVKDISSSAVIGFYMSSSISTVAAKYRLAALLCKNSIQND